ncbi:hypothetical protein PuT2_13715 [Pusillimonas sp. T2]|uniref:alpha/beta hydrolase n=1 Tax=Pusillimonas sp. T2 TaxID=1548123 RepID=UPI000B94665F|nr:alpha/beta hydrolase [Pusillimonas sp. T2]OXR48245.1 hypothetical protein PuT2_13715 [Pusillimonas sp. T2]
MDIALYPAQEPLNENAAAYHAYLIERAQGLTPLEFNYGSDPYQSLALFPAEKPDGRVLLFFHGGGWTNGYKEWMSFMAPALNAKGITFVTAGYRLAPVHTFPTGFNDCAQALDWLWSNVDAYGGDASKIFVGGHSAGGHYAAMLAVSEATAAGIPCRTRIRGCVPVSGVYYFGDNSGMAVRPRFLGPLEAGLDQSASPLHLVDHGLPPFLLTWGDNDFPHLKRQALEMKAALAEQGNIADMLELPGCNHFTASYAAGDIDGMWVNAVDVWSGRLLT